MSSIEDEGLRIRSRGRLPHWEANRSTYFITFRLADSLPANILESYHFERIDIVQTARKLGRQLRPMEINRLEELYSRRVECYLDSGAGTCHLANPRIAEIVLENLRNFNGVKYRLIAWCIMPNHVHLILQPLGDNQLPSFLHSCMSYTAKRANSILGQEGSFWQREYYDHLVRDEADFDRVVAYLLDNPAKAGLSDWPWVGCIEADNV